jgi:hypothetical protein
VMEMRKNGDGDAEEFDVEPEAPCLHII